MAQFPRVAALQHSPKRSPIAPRDGLSAIYHLRANQDKALSVWFDVPGDPQDLVYATKSARCGTGADSVREMGKANQGWGQVRGLIFSICSPKQMLGLVGGSLARRFGTRSGLCAARALGILGANTWILELGTMRCQMAMLIRSMQLSRCRAHPQKQRRPVCSRQWR